MLDLRNVPAVRKLAEDRAREAHNLFARFTWGVEDGWTELDDGAQATLVCVHLALLCDIQRPDSRDAIARLVAERVGLVCGATAPSLYWSPLQRGSRDPDGAPEGDDWPSGWWLSDNLGDMRFFSSDEWCPGEHTMIAGLPDGEEHAAEALTLIALAVLA